MNIQRTLLSTLNCHTLDFNKAFFFFLALSPLVPLLVTTSWQEAFPSFTCLNDHKISDKEADDNTEHQLWVNFP